MNKSKPNYSELNLTIFEQRIHALTVEINLKLNHEEIRRIANEEVNAWQKYVTLDPDAISVLNTLKKSKILALISNFDHPPHIYSLLSNLNLKHFFDSIIISSEVCVKKPDPSIFSFALEQTNLTPSEVCYVGYTKDDVVAAIVAKILPILIQRKINTEIEVLYDYTPEKSLLDEKSLDRDSKKVKIIESLTELMKLV